MRQTYFLTVVLLLLLTVQLNAQTIWSGPDSTFTKAANADWTLETNQDRLTDKVWFTRQSKKPIYNYKWWQDTFGQDPSEDDISADLFNEATILSFTPTGGTKGVKWALLDDTGASSDWTGYNFGTLGNPNYFYSLNNIITIIEILEYESGDFSTITPLDDFSILFNGDTIDEPSIGDYIVGKKFGVWLEEEDIYLTLTFNSWGSGGSGGAFSYTRSTDQTVDVEDIAIEHGIELFPNPATESIQLTGLNSKAQYQIFDVLGVEIKTGLIANQEILDISNFSHGLYFLKVKNGGVIKFLKE